ncbi:hypothetical protein H6764_03250 [Candidatus Nomurabacteria bacterium]|nr:hypothetical protein [Candidatus Nomurabacteria bacterium]
MYIYGSPENPHFNPHTYKRRIPFRQKIDLLPGRENLFWAMYCSELAKRNGIEVDEAEGFLHTTFAPFIQQRLYALSQCIVAGYSVNFSPGAYSDTGYRCLLGTLLPQNGGDVLQFTLSELAYMHMRLGELAIQKGDPLETRKTNATRTVSKMLGFSNPTNFWSFEKPGEGSTCPRVEAIDLLCRFIIDSEADPFEMPLIPYFNE